MYDFLRILTQNFHDFLDRRFIVRRPTPSAVGWWSKKISPAMGLRVGQPAAGSFGRGWGRRRGRCYWQRIIAGNIVLQTGCDRRMCSIAVRWVFVDNVFFRIYNNFLSTNIADYRSKNPYPESLNFNNCVLYLFIIVYYICGSVKIYILY